MIAWPISEVRNRLDIVRAPFTRGPDAHDFDSQLSRARQRFRHSCAIVVAVHYGDVRAHKSKWLSVDDEAGSLRCDELWPSATAYAIATGEQKQNRRACNKPGRGDDQCCSAHVVGKRATFIGDSSGE